MDIWSFGLIISGQTDTKHSCYTIPLSTFRFYEQYFLKEDQSNTEMAAEYMYAPNILKKNVLLGVEKPCSLTL